MLKFIGGLAIGVALGMYLGTFPEVALRLTELGQLLSLSALATLL